MTRQNQHPDRGQTSLDFLVGIGVFFIAVIFVVAFIPSMFAPFFGASASDAIVSDRIADHLVDDRLVDDPHAAPVLNSTAVAEFFNSCEGQLADDLPGSAEHRLNITIGDSYQCGPPTGSDPTVSQRLVTIDDEILRLRVTVS